MNTFKITTANGHNWITTMNCTPEQAQEYFKGHIHVDKDPATGKEIKSPVVKVEQIAEFRIGQMIAEKDRIRNFENLHKNKDARTEFFEKAFADAGYFIPDDLKRVSEYICRGYGISGTCDPVYIANLIAVNTGRGDGRGTFYAPESL